MKVHVVQVVVAGNIDLNPTLVVGAVAVASVSEHDNLQTPSNMIHSVIICALGCPSEPVPDESSSFRPQSIQAAFLVLRSSTRPTSPRRLPSPKYTH